MWTRILNQGVRHIQNQRVQPVCLCVFVRYSVGFTTAVISCANLFDIDVMDFADAKVDKDEAKNVGMMFLDFLQRC